MVPRARAPGPLKFEASGARARVQVKFTAGAGSVQKVLFEISWNFERLLQNYLKLSQEADAASKIMRA